MSTHEISLDLATSLSLLGSATDKYVVQGLRDAGFDGVRAGHGYVFQRLLLGPSTVGEMADVLHVTQQAVSKTVRELVALGYVRQVEDPVDHRRRPVKLSARGRRVIDVGRRLRREFQDSIEEAVGSRRLGTTMRVLDEVIEVLGLRGGVQARSVPAPSEGLS
jgi:DNA-binding MarR family transcriptional regulator